MRPSWWDSARSGECLPRRSAGLRHPGAPSLRLSWTRSVGKAQHCPCGTRPRPRRRPTRPAPQQVARSSRSATSLGPAGRSLRTEAFQALPSASRMRGIPCLRHRPQPALLRSLRFPCEQNGSSAALNKEHPCNLTGPEGPRKESVPVPNIPGGLAVSIVGIVNGAINGIAPQVLVFLRSLGVPV